MSNGRRCASHKLFCGRIVECWRFMLRYATSRRLREPASCLYMTIVTRFPPSPTGSLHIGSARTALFNWLYARHHGGKFILRIEDTDRKRSTAEAVESIFDGLRWLDLDWDGDATFQTSSLDRHAEVAAQLLENGQAYKCYCTPE